MMIRNIRCLWVVLLLSLSQQQLHAMGLGLTDVAPNPTTLSTNLSNVFGSWTPVEDMPAPQVQSNPENNNIQAPAATPSQWELFRDISGNAAQVVSGVPLATKAVIDCKVAMQGDNNPAQPIVFSQEMLKQQEAEHRRSQEQLQTIDALLRNTGGTLNAITRILIAGTYFTRDATKLAQTFQPNPADKGKEEVISPRKEFEFQEEKRTADRLHARFFGGQVIGVLRQTDQTIGQFTSLARELNTGLTTYAGMIARQQPVRTFQEEQIIREHESAQTARYQAMAHYGAIISRNIASTAQSFENIFTSIDFEKRISNLGKVTTDTSVRLALTGAGLYLFCKNIQDADQKKHAVLAGLGVTMMTSPLILARLTA